ncbi:response regulator transcription factor [Kineococcus siccus]|uniref:response regulator transcription factor n=1 Tax=Kineococcus siccus TaxID=2696567 RepID=UPI0030B82145
MVGPTAPGRPARAAVRVLIADDHPVVRRGMGALLSSLDGIDLVGEAATGAEAVREAQLLRPDVVVMDVQMPTMDGVEATRRLRAAVPGVAVLVVTMFEDDETVAAAVRAGARGYLLKGAGQEEIRTAVLAVAAGQLVVGPQVAARLLDHLGHPASTVLGALTSRERDVLDLLARGHGTAAVAAALGLAPKTVGNHVSAVLGKLGVGSRADAVALARREGLGWTGPP